MDGIRQFLLHRIYLFRDSINADNYIFTSNSSEYSAVIALEHCKFGSRSIDLDRDDYEGAPITSSRLKSYLYCYYAHMLSIKNCIINYAVIGNTSNAHGIYCRAERFLQLEEVTVHAPMYYSSYEYRPLQVSDSSGETVEAVIRSVEMKVYFNGAYEYVPLLFYINTFQNAAVALFLLTGCAQQIAYREYFPPDEHTRIERTDGSIVGATKVEATKAGAPKSGCISGRQFLQIR